MKNSTLAIAIPTYNRPDILRESLLSILDDVKKFSISIYISDDSENNYTRIMIANLKKEYANIFYFQNNPGLGHDKNCIKTLSLPNEDYIWYLNDSAVVLNGALNKLMSIISDRDFDFISVNAQGRKLNIEDRIFDNGNELLINLGWHLSQTGATI